MDDNNHAITEKNVHRCTRQAERGACAAPTRVAASNGLSMTSNSSLSGDGYNEFTEQEWKSCVGSFPAGIFDSALSSCPGTVNFLHGMRNVSVPLPNYFYLSDNPLFFFFFFKDLSQSATKWIFSDGAAEADIIRFILNSD